MYLDNLFGANNYLSPYQWGASPTANTNAGNAAAAAPVISSKAPTPVSSANANTDQVSLSDAAQALQAQSAASAASASTQPGASTDFSQEQQMLTTLTDKSLAALGIISPADEANTTISFDSLSYQISSSESAAVAQQGSQSGAAIGASQDATFTGEGHIVTPDGTQYTFQVSLELDQSAQAVSTSDSDSGDSSANNSVGTNGATSTNSANSTNGTDNSTQQPSNLLAQLVNALGLAQTPSTSPNSSSATSASPQNATGNSLLGSTNALGQSSSSGQSTSSATGINWDAILKQTTSLFDLLDSLDTPSQSPAQTPTQVAQTTAQTTSQATTQTLVAA